MCWLPKLFGKKVVVTIHGLDYQRVKWGAIASFYIKLGEKNAARFADEVIVLSEHMKEYFRTAYGRETHFIPNGVNRPVLRDAKLMKEKYELEKDGYILFLGRIVPEKGLQRLLRTFKEVKTGRKLVIAGGSADTDRKFWNELRETAREDPRILFTGFVQGQLLDELYSNAYFCVFPSDLEGMSLSLLEAMSYGNSCVVSDIPEFVEVVEDHALIFQRAGADDFRRKMQMLCDDEALVKDYREGVSDFVCKKYKWDDVVVETLRLYRKVLGLRL